MSHVSFATMLSDVSTYQRAKGRTVIQRLTPSETYIRLRQLGYDLFGIRDAMTSCDIKESVDNDA